MASAARNAAIHLNGNIVSGYFNEEESTFDQTLEDTTVFGTSVTAKTWTPTISEGRLSLRGFWDAAVSLILQTILGSATKQIVAVWHTGDSVGSQGVAMQADEATLKMSANVQSVNRLECEFVSSTGDEHVVSLQSASSAITGDANGTTVDNGAASSNGGAVYNQFFTGGTGMVITVRHSTDNFAASDVLLATFTTGTGSASAERIALTGTIHRYVRVVFNHDGEDATASVALHRS